MHHCAVRKLSIEQKGITFTYQATTDPAKVIFTANLSVKSVFF